VISNKRGSTSHGYRDMAIFPLKFEHFAYPPAFNPDLKMFPLHYIAKILHA